MLNINLGERCRKTGGAKTLKCDEKLVRLEEQIKSVSINTEITCTIPCFAGWLTDALAAAFGALPIPASLENRPLLIPITTALPAIPPKIA